MQMSAESVIESGRAPLVLCDSCGWVGPWQVCDTATDTAEKDVILCLHCGELVVEYVPDAG
jgi:primosomal protein N'